MRYCIVPVFCCLFHSMCKGKKVIYMANDCFEFKWMGTMMMNNVNNNVNNNSNNIDDSTCNKNGNDNHIE